MSHSVHVAVRRLTRSFLPKPTVVLPGTPIINVMAEFHPVGVSDPPPERKCIWMMQGVHPEYALHRFLGEKLGKGRIVQIRRRIVELIQTDPRLRNHRLVTSDIEVYIGPPVVCNDPKMRRVVAAWLNDELDRDLKLALARGANKETVSGISKKIDHAKGHASEEICVACAWTKRSYPPIRVFRPQMDIEHLLGDEFLQEVSRLA